MEIVRTHFDSLGEEILLRAEIYFPTFFRTEVWITESGATEGRGGEQLVQGWRSKALGITAFQLGADFLEKIRRGECGRPSGAELLIVVQTDSRDHDQAAVEKLKLLLQIVADIADGFVDSPAGAGRPAIVLDTKSRSAPVSKAVVGLKLPSRNLWAKDIAGAGIQRIGVDVIAKLVMFFIDRSENSVIPICQNFLCPLKFADVLSRSLASVGIGYGCKIVVVEQAHAGVDEMKYPCEVSVLGYLIVQPRRCGQIVIIVVDAPKAIARQVANAQGIAEVSHSSSDGRNLTVGPTIAALKGDAHIQWPLASFADDIDYAADGLRAVKSATGAAEDFDPLDVIGRQVGEVIGTRGCAVYFNAIDHDQYLIGCGAANENGSRSSHRTVLNDIDAGDIAQDLRYQFRLPLANVFSCDDSEGCRELIEWNFRACSGYNHWRKTFHGGEFRGSRKGRKQNEKQNNKDQNHNSRLFPRKGNVKQIGQVSWLGLQTYSPRLPTKSKAEG